MMILFHLLKIWSILPSFCKDCTDITASFSSVAKILGTALSDKPEICPVICQALVNLIEGSRNNGKTLFSFFTICSFFFVAIPYSSHLFLTKVDILSLSLSLTFSFEPESDRVQLSKFSKNYLPILFNLYTAEPSATEGTRDSAVLNCIKCYLSVTEKKVFSFLFPVNVCH